MAAITVAQEGKSVILQEPGKHTGGMVSGGLGATDAGNREAIGGYLREFFRHIRQYYVKTYGEKSNQVKDCSDGFHFEPHVAEQILITMLKEAKVEVRYGQRLIKVKKTSIHIDSLTTTKGDSFAANEFIDASYEGDLIASAGVKYTIGRESREKHHESLAGVQKHSPAHQWPLPVSACDTNKKRLPLVQEGLLQPPGSGDKKVQAYNYRLCLTQRRDNQVPVTKAESYNPERYELLARYLAKRPKLTVRQLMDPSPMPNGKTDVNNKGPISTDHIGANWDYPDGDQAIRNDIEKDHRAYVQGFLYFLGHDPQVPKALKEEMITWGLSKDEFADNDNWPHQLYVREGQRMLGGYVMTQADIQEKRTKDDTIGLGSYNADSHHVQRIVDTEGNVLNEGDFQVPVKPYAIPYRSLLPRPEECENLLVPVCLSASHVAYGSIRMEPVYMILGQACGNAAVLAVTEKTNFHKAPIEKLQAKPKEQKAVLR
jgi:hypothetical protein